VEAGFSRLRIKTDVCRPQKGTSRSPSFPQHRMECQYCDETTTEKLPFCEHHAHPVCVLVAYRFRYRECLECPTCHAKQTGEIRILRTTNDVVYSDLPPREGEHLLILEAPAAAPAAPAAAPRVRHRRRRVRRVAAPAAAPAAPAAAPAAAQPNERAVRRAVFDDNVRAGRIPNTAVFGGIHDRNCGHRGCNRRTGAMGVRFLDGRYRCEVHR